MALQTIHATLAKNALADKAVGGSSMYQPRYIVFGDANGLLMLCENTAPGGAPIIPSVKPFTGTVLAPAEVASGIKKMYLIGDRGLNSIPTIEAARAIVAAGLATMTGYLLVTTDDDGGADLPGMDAVVGGDTLQGTFVGTSV